MTSRSKIEGRIGSPEGSQLTAIEVPASVRESSPNNRLQVRSVSLKPQVHTLWGIGSEDNEDL
jgi:hypothetical protein